MSSPHLTARELAAWRGFNEMRALLVSRVSKDLAADSGLTEADYSVLLSIVESPGRVIHSRTLLQQLAWEPSRLSHQLSRMETRGTISRSKRPDDARSFDLAITETGLQAMRRASPEHFRSVRRWFVDALTPEQLDAMTELADAVAAHITTLDDGCSKDVGPPPEA